MEIRALNTLDDMVSVEEVQRLAWGCTDREIVPPHLLYAAAHHGGCLLGGFEGDILVGFVYAFAAGDYLYSHLAAVRPNFRGRGHGVALKRAQAVWAREHGFPRIVWTFDPLQARNCQINLHIIGATSQRYLVDYYGELDDDINRGIPTDRLEVDWWLDGRPRANRRERVAYPWPLAPGQRLEWRLKLRQALQEAFAGGLSVVDFEMGEAEAVLCLG